MPTVEDTIFKVAELESRVTEIEKLLKKMSKELNTIIEPYKEAVKKAKSRKRPGLV